MSKPIHFYAPYKSHGFLSNFYQLSFEYQGQNWPTSEHAFQAMKFWPHKCDLVASVRTASTARAAAMIGRDKSNPIRPDWELPPKEGLLSSLTGYSKPIPSDYDNNLEPVFARTKDAFMFAVCLHKFRMPTLRKALLDTSLAILVEACPIDSYWGVGPQNNGQNKLGRILMAVRADISL